jgi:hypothetical protein
MLVARGIDAFKETLHWRPRESFCSQLEAAKQAALQNAERGRGEPFQLGGVDFLCMPSAGGNGKKWLLRGEDFDIQFRSPRTDWPISIEYRSTGLWRKGLDGLRETARRILRPVTVQLRSDARLSRLDYAFDFHVPGLGKALGPKILDNVVAPVQAKRSCEARLWANGAGLQTLTIGSHGNLRVQLYDKGAEIHEASGKFWMVDIWKEGGYVEEDDMQIRDVWRLELSFAKEYLQYRDCRDPDKLAEFLPAIVREGLQSYRLTIPKPTDTNKRRWPLHPVWEAALAVTAEAQTRPRRFRTENTREELQVILSRNIAGTLRSHAVLGGENADRDELTAIALQAVELALADPLHNRKTAEKEAWYAGVENSKS